MGTVCAAFFRIALTFVERMPLQRQIVMPVFDPEATSVGTSEDLYTASSASSDASSSTQTVRSQSMNVQGRTFSSQGGNTATPTGPGQDPNHVVLLADRDDAMCFMQRIVAPASFVPFAVACAGGLPYLKTLRLTRRELTQTWQDFGIDVVYEHFRSRENGIWEKKIMGWSFLQYGQLQGEPFTVWMRRTGLWSTQLISPFEDEGCLAMSMMLWS